MRKIELKLEGQNLLRQKNKQKIVQKDSKLC